MEHIQKGKYINYNGDNIRSENFSIPVYNRGFKYGDGIFETIRTANKEPLFFKEHLTRLFFGMNLLKFDFDSHKSETKIYNSIKLLLDANKHFSGARIRITVFRDGKGLYTPETNEFNFLVESNELETNEFKLNKKGLKIDIFKDIRLRYSEFSSIKTLNSLPYILAGNYKNKNKLDDCLLLNSTNVIVEAISSNLFVVKGNSIITPSLSEGGINGITKNIIIDIALSKKYTLIEDAQLRETDLLNADEIFLTNSISGITWVAAYKNKRYFNKTAKKLLLELNSLV